MSTAPLPASIVFAFGEPIVKNGDVLLPIRVGREIQQVQASAALWRDVAVRIVSLTAPSLLIPPAQPLKRKHGNCMSAEKAARYDAALADYKTGNFYQGEAARRHGIRPQEFNRWLSKGRLIASRMPIEKPSGGIL